MRVAGKGIGSILGRWRAGHLGVPRLLRTGPPRSSRSCERIGHGDFADAGPCARWRRGGWSSVRGAGSAAGGRLRRRRRGAGGGDRAERGRQDDAALDPGRDRSSPTGARSSSPRGAVGWVPQQAALYRRLTVEENLLLFARLEKHEDPRASVEEMLELTGLGERRGEIVARLSGGNQQRINIAIGLLSRPVVLLLDEPSVGLDPRQRARLWEFVSASPARGTTVIFSTHDIQEAERYGRRLLVLADGESLFDGSPEGLREAVRSEAPEAAEPRLRDRLRRLPPPPGALTDALAAAQGPADPAPLAAAGRAAGRLPGADRGPGRLRDLARTRASRGSPSSTKSRRARGSAVGGAQAARGRGQRPDLRAGRVRPRRGAAPKRSTRSAPATRWRR